MFEHDPFIQEIVDGGEHYIPRGLEMGFKADTDLDEIVNVFLEDDLLGQHVFYD